MPETLLLEYRITELERRLEAQFTRFERTTEEQEKQIKILEEKITKRENERDVEEKKKLIWGISFLGSIILSLLGIIWNFRSAIFKGVDQ